MTARPPQPLHLVLCPPLSAAPLALPPVTCDLCRQGPRLTGALCQACRSEIGPEVEALASRWSADLDLTRPADGELWAAVVAVGQAAVLRYFRRRLGLLRRPRARRTLGRGIPAGPGARPRP